MPGVDAKTHANMNTGGNDSKFGLPVSVVSELIQHLDGHDRLEVAGVHVHIGSQILSVEQFASAVEALKPLGGLAVYDLGGGLGIAHHEGEQAPSVDDYLDTLIGAAERYLPADARILIEPGRSTVARSGVIAYRTVVTKETGRRFVAVDGGMADFVEVALTGQRFSALVANRATAVPNSRVQLVGRQCESGDLLIDQAELPDPRIDDVIVIPATGAYTYTMTNNYNGAARPAVVFVKDGKARLAVRRETTEDLLRLHQAALDHDWTTSAVPATTM
jgi:diaminopimelate decarboxylase